MQEIHDQINMPAGLCIKVIHTKTKVYKNVLLGFYRGYVKFFDPGTVTSWRLVVAVRLPGVQ